MTLIFFRPISNLSFSAKLIERIVANQFMEHANSSHLLPTRQSAYRRTYSSETAVTAVHNDIVCAVDQGHVAALVLLDLGTAFDTVDHSTLLNLLQCRILPGWCSKRDLCYGDVAGWLGVCLSVTAGIVSKWLNLS